MKLIIIISQILNLSKGVTIFSIYFRKQIPEENNNISMVMDIHFHIKGSLRRRKQ